METKLYRAITGHHITHQEMIDIGLRILTLHRALTARSMNTKNLRRDHDLMNDWMFDNSKDAVPFTPGHSKMDRKDMVLARDLFYEEMGYEKSTGMPTRVGLERLKLGDVADGLEKLGLLV
jgi:aldehyde:ferredoxin oxidoreductase